MKKIQLSLVLGAVALATTVLFLGEVRAADGPQTTVAQAIPGITGDDDPYLWLEQKDAAQRAGVGERGERARRSRCCRMIRTTRGSLTTRCRS